MKTIITKKALNRALERAKSAKYLVDTGVVGTINMALMQIANESFCEAWVTGDNAASGKHIRFQAYGTEISGEVLISNFGDPPSLHLVGKGQDEHGVVLLVQRAGDVFTVVWNSDLPDNKAVFFMVATSNALIVQLISLLAEKHFSDIKSDDLQKAIALLTGGRCDE